MRSFCEVEELRRVFQMESSAKKQFQAKNKQNHNLGTGRYVGKKDKWQVEDPKLANKGRANPWLQFPGRSQSYLRARGTLSDRGEITFKSSETEIVTQKVKEIATYSFEGSFTGSRNIMCSPLRWETMSTQVAFEACPIPRVGS